MVQSTGSQRVGHSLVTEQQSSNRESRFTEASESDVQVSHIIFRVI